MKQINQPVPRNQEAEQQMSIETKFQIKEKELKAKLAETLYKMFKRNPGRQNFSERFQKKDRQRFVRLDNLLSELREVVINDYPAETLKVLVARKRRLKGMLEQKFTETTKRANILPENEIDKEEVRNVLENTTSSSEILYSDLLNIFQVVSNSGKSLPDNYESRLTEIFNIRRDIAEDNADIIFVQINKWSSKRGKNRDNFNYNLFMAINALLTAIDKYKVNRQDGVIFYVFAFLLIWQELQLADDYNPEFYKKQAIYALIQEVIDKEGVTLEEALKKLGIKMSEFQRISQALLLESAVKDAFFGHIDLDLLKMTPSPFDIEAEIIRRERNNLVKKLIQKQIRDKLHKLSIFKKRLRNSTYQQELQTLMNMVRKNYFSNEDIDDIGNRIKKFKEKLGKNCQVKIEINMSSTNIKQQLNYLIDIMLMKILILNNKQITIRQLGDSFGVSHESIRSRYTNIVKGVKIDMDGKYTKQDFF